MTTTLATCVAKLSAELASDMLHSQAQARGAASNNASPFWGGRSLKKSNSSITSPTASLSLTLSDEDRLQRFLSLDELREQMGVAPIEHVRQVQEVALTMVLEKALPLGDSVAFRDCVVECIVILLSRADARFIDDAFGRLLDSLATIPQTPLILTSLDSIRAICVKFPAHRYHFQPTMLQLVKRLLKSNDPTVRAAALTCLSTAIAGEAASPLLSKVLGKAINDKAWQVRAALAQCAVYLANPFEMMLALLDDKEAEVRQAASAACAAIDVAPDTVIARCIPCQRLLFGQGMMGPLARIATVDALVAILDRLALRMTNPQKTTLAGDLVMKLVPPRDAFTARSCAELIIGGVLLSSDSSARDAVCRSVIAISSFKNASVWMVTAGIDVCNASLMILGPELSPELKDDALELLLAALSNPHSHVRLQAASALQTMALTQPAQTVIILRILQNVAAIHIAEATVSVGDTRDMGLALTAMHGHFHAIAALVSIAGSLDAGIPDDIMTQLFKTASNLAALYMGDLLQNMTFALVAAECSWVLLDALLSQGATSTQLLTLFPLWKAYMKPSGTGSIAEIVGVGANNAAATPRHIAAAFHIRRWALSALRTLARCTGTQALLAQPAILKPIAALLNEAIVVSEASKFLQLDDDLVRIELLAFRSTMLDVFSYLPLAVLPSRFVPLLHICVAELASRQAPLSLQLDARLNPADAVLSLNSTVKNVSLLAGGLHMDNMMIKLIFAMIPSHHHISLYINQTENRPLPTYHHHK